ncbi:MAG: metallophosphoesterase [Bdellovibrio sp.]|nr:metallophosphoesterase [Bdellovibrio sp.]
MVSLYYTAIISDLHLTDPEPPRHKDVSKHPMWKKFKTREFFIDDALISFLDNIEKKANGGKVELILNGDIFDFDSVMSLPLQPIYNISWLETRRGLFPKEEKSIFKAQVILEEHAGFFRALAEFIKRGNRLVIIPGNHDVEFHFPKVQKLFIDFLKLDDEDKLNVRFVSWFYISEKDTLIEHGNQQDPYCMCEDPVNPFLLDYNELSIRLPFGNVACRYMMNGLGLFNPHVEKNYIMNLSGYIKFFFKYLIQAQPLIIWTWLWSSVATLWHVTADRFAEPFKLSTSIEKKLGEVAEQSNTTPGVVRELKELFITPATQKPLLIAKELWLDRLFLILFAFVAVYFVVSTLKSYFGISLFWIFVPLLLMVPFFLFYARSVTSLVSQYKEPDEQLLAKQSAVTGVRRIVYGHTHIARHEYYGAVEHLNSGSWSPAFTDVECTEAYEKNTYVWIAPMEEDPTVRKAELLQFSSKKPESSNQPHQIA